MKTIEENFVSYAPALLAKENGFDEECLCSYLDNKQLFTRYAIYKNSEGKIIIKKIYL